MCSGCGIDHSNGASSTYNFQCNSSMHRSLFIAYILYYRLEMKDVYIYMLNVKFLFSSEIAVLNLTVNCSESKCDLEPCGLVSGLSKTVKCTSTLMLLCIIIYLNVMISDCSLKNVTYSTS